MTWPLRLYPEQISRSFELPDLTSRQPASASSRSTGIIPAYHVSSWTGFDIALLTGMHMICW